MVGSGGGEMGGCRLLLTDLRAGRAFLRPAKLPDCSCMSTPARLAPLPKLPTLPTLAGRAYRCRCGQPVFFLNSQCLVCGAPLGYEPDTAELLPLQAGPLPGTWQHWPTDDEDRRPAEPTQRLFQRCANFAGPAACNWLVPISAPPAPQASAGPPVSAIVPLPTALCKACRLNRTIPDLNDPGHPDNGLLWGQVEQAKRRLISALIVLGLPVASRITEDPEHGLMFDFLRDSSASGHVHTGHESGLITINLEEADDATREATRKAMREPYRTLLGHFRHEVGHYYWDRLVQGSDWLDRFRALFGDERSDYAAALQRNYAEGPRPDWPLHYVSAYASSHPWEDWAECWAHYLHMRDTVDTALSLGLSTERMPLAFTPFTMAALWQPKHPGAARFLAFLNTWTQLTTLLNEMSRAMGQPDFYPFVLPREVVAKLHFIHLLVSEVRPPA